ncbi:MAG: class II glutamine amidotransferase [Patescibacteria group bacterium]
MFDIDGWMHECGVIGIIRGDPAHRLLDLTYEGLLSLQHRGQEAAGLALADGRHVRKHKSWGRVETAIPGSTMQDLAKLYNGVPFEPRLAIGHVRYATAGSSDLRNAQPHYIEPVNGRLVIASNGDVANYREVRLMLEREGVEINTENDGELLLKTIEYLRTKHGLSLVDAIRRMTQMVKGFSYVFNRLDLYRSG